MKVVRFPLEGLNRSGGTRVVVELANALAREGFSPVLVVPEYAQTSPFDLDPRVQLEVVTTRLKGRLRKGEYLLKVAAHATTGADMVVATSYRTPWVIVAGQLWKNTRVRRLYLVQHYETLSQGWLVEGSHLRGALNALIAEVSYLLPFQRVAVSNWIREQLPFKGSTEVVLNGVNSAVFRPKISPARLPNQPIVIGCIGRRGRLKGWDVFLQAVDRIPRAHRRLLVATPAGLDPVHADREDLTLIQPANDDEVADFYRACDIFVYPSLLEGFGLPPLEAMACGIPVISSDCGGTADFLSESNALVVPPGNVAALTEAMERLIHNPGERERLRAAGLSTAAELTVQRSMAEYIRLITRLLQSNGA